jgi:hypothetical protein
MVDDGFLIGFEDSSGNFVEVGRFNNTADDVTQPLEIKHANSGERIALDSSGFETRSITTTDSVTVTDGEATNTIHYGSDQDRSNAGINGTAIGIGARVNKGNSTVIGVATGRSSTGLSITLSGGNSGRQNVGDELTARGFNCARNNTGDFVTGSGKGSLKNNTGAEVTMSGVNSARDNSGSRVTGSGIGCARNNTGDRVTAIGFKSAQGAGLSDPTTMGDDNIGIGVSAIRNNQASGLIAIGQEAGINAQTDDQLIITDRNGNRRMVMDLTNGDLKIEGSLTQNATL